ncbi:MAG: SIS domain-containing protein [Chloroflexia bacterium]|nr:SIS domain-containing protein [Chloroflexia bacterium]
MDQRIDAAEVLALARETIRQDAAAVTAAVAAVGEGFERAVGLLFACRGKAIVTGMGTSGATAQRIAHLLAVGGTPAFFAHPADGLHGGLGAVTGEDVVLAISKGGESAELNEYVSRAKGRGAKIVAMTAEPASTLAGLADAAILVKTPIEADPGGMIAMGSALANCAVGDGLVVALMTLRRYPWQSFEFTHPGGAVGRGIAERARANDPAGGA